MATSKQPRPSRFSAYFARLELDNLQLTSISRQKIGVILDLLSQAPDDQISVAAIFQAFYPHGEDSPQSANKALQRLTREVNQAAEAAGRSIRMETTSAKGAENRFLFFSGFEPEPNAANTDDLNAIPEPERYETRGIVQEAVVALVTFNSNETAAVLEQFKKLGQPQNGPTYNILGQMGGTTIIHCVSEQGENRAQQSCNALIETVEKEFPFQPLRAVIGLGVAFGIDQNKQRIGDVLVAKSVYDYESVRQGEPPEYRGETYPCSGDLRQLFNHFDQTQKAKNANHWPTLYFGTLLSGDKLIDDQKFRDQLKSLASGVIGGEMEGVGIFHAAERKHIDWLIVKGICDWADGNKNNSHKEQDQRQAAKNSALVVYETLSYWLSSEGAGLMWPSLHDLDAIQRKRDRIMESKGVPVSMQKDSIPEARSTQGANALDTLLAWAKDRESPQCFALLGEYGMGKTIVCQRLVKELDEQRQKDRSLPLALYFDLRHVTGLNERVPTLEDTLAECMKRGWINLSGTSQPVEQLYSSLAKRAAIIIYDGLDEVLVKLNAADGQTFTRNLLKIAEDIKARRQRDGLALPPLKILISCRTHFFRTLRDQQNHFTGQERGQFKAETFVSMLLLPLEEEQVALYLQNAFPELDANTLMETIGSVHNLEELSRRPITLRFIADFLPDIEKDRAAGKTIYGVSLYEKMANRWLERDAGKHHIEPRHKMPMVEHLAAYLWREGDGVLKVDKLEDWLLEWLDSDPKLERRYQRISPDQLEEDLRTATFLVREDRREGEEMLGLFRFAHTSLLEFFLARYLFTALRGNQPERWQMKTSSQETLDFFGQLLAERREETPALLRLLNTWGQNRRDGLNELILNYTLRAREKGWPQPALRGLKLNHADLPDYRFAGSEMTLLDLREADFSHANLRRAQFAHVCLDAASFYQAKLTQSCFVDCSAQHTQWCGAECAGAAWRKVDLRASDWTEASGKGPQFFFCADAPRPQDSGAWQEPCILPSEQTATLPISIRCIEKNSHSDGVGNAAWSPDGTRLLATDRNNLAVWDAESGSKLLTIWGNDGMNCCTWSPDGSRILSGDAGGNLIVWDGNNGQKLLAMKMDRHINCCAWSPDGSQILSTDQGLVSQTGEVGSDFIVWDGENGQKLLAITTDKTIFDLAWSPDGGRLLLRDSGGNLIVLDGGNWQRLLEIKAANHIFDCAWSPDSSRIISGDKDGNLIVWDGQSGQRLLSMKMDDWVACCTWSPDGWRLLSGDWKGNIIVWDGESGQRLLVIKMSNRIVHCVWSPDGKRLLLIGAGANLTIWDKENWQELLATKVDDGSCSCVWSPDGRLLLSRGLWDGQTGQRLLAISIHGGIWSPNGKRLLSRTQSRNLIVWDSCNGQKLLTMKTDDGIRDYAWSPDGSRIVSADDNSNLTVWDGHNGQRLLTMKTDRATQCCVWAPDSTRLLSADMGGNLIVWDGQNGQRLLTMKAGGGRIDTCAWSPDSSRILLSNHGYSYISKVEKKSCEVSGNLIVWDGRTGQRLLEVKTDHDIYGCAWSPDGRRLFESRIHKLIVWDWYNGQKLLEVKVKGSINHCTWSPDGERLLFSDYNRLIVWNADNGEELLTMLVDFHVSDCAWSPDGSQILSGDMGGNAIIWDGQSGEKLRQFCFIGDSQLCWEPSTGKILSASGLFWRDFYWDVTLADGRKQRLPIEAFDGELG